MQAQQTSMDFETDIIIQDQQTSTEFETAVKRYRGNPEFHVVHDDMDCFTLDVLSVGRVRLMRLGLSECVDIIIQNGYKIAARDVSRWMGNDPRARCKDSICLKDRDEWVSKYEILKYFRAHNSDKQVDKIANSERFNFLIQAPRKLEKFILSTDEHKEAKSKLAKNKKRAQEFMAEIGSDYPTNRMQLDVALVLEPGWTDEPLKGIIRKLRYDSTWRELDAARESNDDTYGY